MLLSRFLMLEAAVTTSAVFSNFPGNTVLIVDTIDDYVYVADVDAISYCP